MKIRNNIGKVILYSNKNDDLLLSLKLDNINSLLTLGHHCDLCNAITTTLYLPPELCNYALCENCFKEYSQRSKWYTEDMSPTFNTLISYVVNSDLSFSEEELDLINKYLNEHSHREHLDIHKFMN